MSVSPQSLARTRDKRSLKVPARFNDTVYALNEPPEVLRTSTRSRPGSLSSASKRNHDEDIEDNKEEVIKAIKGAFRPSVAFKRQAISKSNSNSQNETTTPARPLAEQTPNSPTTPTQSTSPSSQAASPVAISTTATAPVSAQHLVMESSPQAAPSKAKSPPATTTTPEATTAATGNIAEKTKPTHLVSINSLRRIDSGSISLLSPANPQTAPKKKKKEFARKTVPTLEERQEEAKKTKEARVIADRVKLPPPKASSRSKSQKQPEPPQTTAATNTFSSFKLQHQFIRPKPAQINFIVSDDTSSPAPATNMASTPQTTRYFNNLNPNQQQFGTRLLLNEPIYLPRSVGPIAPITTTLPQIAIQARKPPFISEKAEACLAYQDERKLDYITSIHAALVKIAQHLGVTDRLNLRCVNKTWKSVVDSESVWKRVLLNRDDSSVDLTKLIENYPARYRTTDLIFDEYIPSACNCDFNPRAFGEKLMVSLPGLRRIWMKSVNDVQNCVAYNILDGLMDISRDKMENNRVIKCQWQVKIGVDPYGIATVDLNVDKIDAPDYLLNSYQNADEENHNHGERDKTKTIVELYDLRKKFRATASSDVRKTDPNSADCCVKVDIKPI